MTDLPEIAEARQEVARTRARLMSTAHELQDRLSPKMLAKGAWEGAKEKGADLAEDTIDAVKARPLAATGVVAAIAMFLAREPLFDLASRLVDGVSDKRKTKKRRKPAAKQPQTESTQ
jgi:ElaB/YqjD/DUF883 family membrane-anchored ribosome-binding protein